MKLPRVRFTVRRMMAAVAVVSGVFGAERLLFHYATELVRSSPGEGYL
jgi:hypothetical protein